MKKIILFSLLVLAACTNEEPLKIYSEPVKVSIVEPAEPLAVQMLPVNFRVITKDNIDAFITELSGKQGDKPVFIAITFRDYENMALNLADLRRYIEQQTAIIVYYQAVTKK